MNYIKYKHKVPINLDKILFIEKVRTNIAFYQDLHMDEITWLFSTEEECDKVLALIDKAANCKDLEVTDETVKEIYTNGGL